MRLAAPARQERHRAGRCSQGEVEAVGQSGRVELAMLVEHALQDQIDRHEPMTG
jgi:hypothetical protein